MSSRTFLLRIPSLSAIALALALALSLSAVCPGQSCAAARGSKAQVFKGWGGGKSSLASMTAGTRRVKMKRRNPMIIRIIRLRRHIKAR